MTYAVPARPRDDDAQWQRKEALVTRYVRELFNRLPALAGFRLRSDLMVADVSIVGYSKSLSIRRLHVRVMQAFVELAECDPEAIVLMRGRTFARTRH
jgi:hypothetical protein